MKGAHIDFSCHFSSQVNLTLLGLNTKVSSEVRYKTGEREAEKAQNTIKKKMHVLKNKIKYEITIDTLDSPLRTCHPQTT